MNAPITTGAPPSKFRGYFAVILESMPASMGRRRFLASSAALICAPAFSRSESEPLPAGYRAHGSLHEVRVPLLICNSHARIPATDFQYNRELARWLYA